MIRWTVLTALTVASLCVAADLPADYAPPDAPGQYLHHKNAATLPAGRPLVATSYFYWYDAATKPHIVDHDGSDALTDHPPTLKGMSYRSVAWHEEHLRDMIRAGGGFTQRSATSSRSYRPSTGRASAASRSCCSTRRRLRRRPTTSCSPRREPCSAKRSGATSTSSRSPSGRARWGAALMPQLLDIAAVGSGYDHSAVPGRSPLVRKRLGGTKTWKQVTIALSRARFAGRANGADVRLTVTGGDLAVSHVAVGRP